jgi:hypothetical protein
VRERKSKKKSSIALFVYDCLPYDHRSEQTTKRDSMLIDFEIIFIFFSFFKVLFSLSPAKAQKGLSQLQTDNL